MVSGGKLGLAQRIDRFQQFMDTSVNCQRQLYLRTVVSAADREVLVTDPYSTEPRKMLMFGSNNYLGLANHPRVRERAMKALRDFGAGVAGPPLLNGYTSLHRELEERLSAFKRTEDTLLFSTGYSANIGIATALMQTGDTVFYDQFSHASLADGLRICRARSFHFAHNDVKRLERLLAQKPADGPDQSFVAVEGVYSMDGDMAPLDRIAALCRAHRATLVVDDAHGTGVVGPTGAGTAEQFGVEPDLNMGTFSKVFGVVGGFVSASRPIINYLRYFARSYMFSASLPPMVIGAVLGGLEVIEREPELRQRLRQNVDYAASELGKIGFEVHPAAGIIALRVPQTVNIRQAAWRLHELGIFVNSIEYPAVPIHEQRFRISLMATHTRADIDRLVAAIAEVTRKATIHVA
jgi:glycine C-acetyltransferase